MNYDANILILALLSGASGSVQAASPGDLWYIHVGAARYATDEAAAVRVMGSPVAGSGVRLDPRYTAAVELGRFIAPNLVVSLSAGVPVKQSVRGSGTIQPLGRLGRITYGPAAATVHWHPWATGAVRPYLGGGISYLHVFASGDAAVRDFGASDTVGPLAQGGLEVPVGHSLGLFADVKKAWLRTTATGSLGGAPVRARIRLDPLVLHSGLAVRF